MNVVRSINDANITFDIKDNAMNMVYSKGEITLPVFDSYGYPFPEEWEMNEFVTMKSEDLFNVLKEAMLFASDDDVRLILCGVYMNFEDNASEFAATNGRKMYANTTPCDCQGTQMKGVLRNKVIQVALNVVNNSENVHISLGEKSIYIKTFDAMFYTRAIEGNYPNYRQVIPAQYNTEVCIDKQELIDAIKRVGVATGTSGLLSFGVEGSSLIIKARDLEYSKKAHETHLCNVSGGDVTIGVNNAMMLDALNSVSSDIVALRIQDATRPLVVCDLDNASKTIVVMPMRID